MKSTNDKIDTIFEAYRAFLLQKDNYELMLAYPKNVAIQATKQLIKETLQECIDNTVENLEYDDEDYTVTPVVHQLRQEAHAKLDELLK